MYTVLMYMLLTVAAANSDEIYSNTLMLKGMALGYDIQIEQHAIPKNLLSKAVTEALKREKVQQLTLTYDNDSKEMSEYLESEAKARRISVRSISESVLNEMQPGGVDKVSVSERAGLRTLLIIRCVGLGAGLFVGTGSSLAIAAYAGIFNYILMETLYIPKRNGHMPGVDFVSALMSKATNLAKKNNPNISSARLSVVEGFTNFIINYTMNLAMLIPFLGMTGADFKVYLEAFVTSDLYLKSAYLATLTTLFLSSWKMAASKWEKLRSEKKINVVNSKTQSRLINGIDFIMSFVNPGFWAGQFANQIIVTTVGITGFLAYFYYDVRDVVFTKISDYNIFNKRSCAQLFDN
ncbi:MAG: hypothetical protein KDD37_11580 [Bdellovibrionales bacterium]|nr:hypothetical protein [Bdellovibrionales bacterium]